VTYKEALATPNDMISGRKDQENLSAMKLRPSMRKRAALEKLPRGFHPVSVRFRPPAPILSRDQGLLGVPNFLPWRIGDAPFANRRGIPF